MIVKMAAIIVIGQRGQRLHPFPYTRRQGQYGARDSIQAVLLPGLQGLRQYGVAIRDTVRILTVTATVLAAREVLKQTVRMRLI